MISSPVISLRVLVAAAYLLGCAAETSDADGNESAEDDFKGCPPGIPQFEPGVQAMGSHYAVKVLSAAPLEPERYTNNWKVELDALDGSAAADVQIEKTQTFMPIHGHDGMVVPEVTALDDAGQFAVERLTFTMRGPWEARFWLHGADVTEDYVVLHVCVAK